MNETIYTIKLLTNLCLKEKPIFSQLIYYGGSALKILTF